MDGGWVLDQSALALQDSQKDTYYILHYIAEPFTWKKIKAIKHKDVKNKNNYKSLKQGINNL